MAKYQLTYLLTYKMIVPIRNMSDFAPTCTPNNMFKMFLKMVDFPLMFTKVWHQILSFDILINYILYEKKWVFWL